jgi:glycosyltransferase involved in cell wall biosynthesis
VAACFSELALSVLYVTQNGITDHIGQSQIAPYVLGLADLGYQIHVLSAEKNEKRELVEKYESLFNKAGIRWTRILYRRRPKVIGPLITQWQLRQTAHRTVEVENIRLVHCRSHPAALIGYYLKKRYGIKFIFDFRDFYADGGLLKTRGLMRLAYSRMKQLEGPMIQVADKVICLTERAKSVLSGWYFSNDPEAGKRFQIIPCCADFNHFNPALVTKQASAGVRQKLGLAPDQTVLLYLGSLGPDYLLQQMMLLFRQLLTIRPSAKFLVVCNEGHDLVVKECVQQGMDPACVVVRSATREEVPTFISLADFSVVFIRADITKAGCSPTKLAELFAMNVPVIANTGVGDLDTILDLDQNGSVIVKDFLESTLAQAIEALLNHQKNGLVAIRENSTDFDLPSGVKKYASVYSELLGAT